MTVLLSGDEIPTRTTLIGDAPIVQSGVGGQWATAWSKAGVTMVHKADVTSGVEVWSAVKISDLLATSLAGGDIYAGDLGVSGQSAATSSVKQEIDGKEAIRFNLTQSATAVSLDLTRLFSGDDGTAFSEGGRVRLFDASGGLVSESFFSGNSSGGTLHVDVSSATLFKSVEISAGVRRADGSFSYGGYANSDGSFGSDIYADSVKHGSDFLLDKIAFEFARPVATGESYTLDEDTTLQGTSVLTNDSDPDNLALTATLVSGTSHGSLTFNPDGTFNYSPDANYFGADSFVYRATDGQDSSLSTTVTLNVNSVNDAPIALNDKTSTDEDTAITGNVIDGSLGGKDTDVDVSDTLVIASPGALLSSKGASVVLNVDGTFSYDPTTSATLHALNTGDSTVDSFTYTVSDGHGGTSTASVDVSVAGISNAAGQQVVLPSAAPGTQLHYFIKFVGGSSVADKWLDLGSFSTGFSNSGSLGGAGGGLASGKLTAQDVHTMLGASNTGVDLTETLLKGTHLKSVEIEAYRTNSITGDLQLVDDYLFEEALVSSVQSSASADSGIASGISVNYGKFGYTHVDYDAKGAKSTTTSTGWDLTKNVLSDGPAATGEAANSKLGEQASTESNLDYYVKFDGAAGWLDISALSLGFQNSSTILSGGGGAGTGKALASDVSLMLGSSGEIVNLTHLLASGTILKNVEIEVYSHVGGKAQLVDDYLFENVLMTSLATGSDSANSVSFAYSKFSETHIGLDAKGLPQAPNSVGWDFESPGAYGAEQKVADKTDTNVLPSTAPGTELHYFIKFVGGSSVADKWLDLGSFSTGFSNSGSLGGAGGGLASGKLTAQDVHTMLGASNTGVDLTETLLKGTHLKSVEIEAYRTNSITGDLQLVDDYLFEEALVSSVQSSASADSGIASGISVNYGKFGYTHVDYDAKGAKSTTTSTGWDLTKNVLSDGPAATGEAANSKLGEQASTESNLDYYVKFDGAAGWLDISALSLGFSNSGSSSIGGGAGTGKASASDVSLILGSSGEIVNLTHLLASGTILKNVEIEVYSHVGGKAQLVDDYLFENVLMTSLATGSDSANSVSFAYSKFSETHIGLDAKGLPQAPNSVGWDFESPGAYGAEQKVADKTDTNVLPSTAPGTELHYFIKFVGGSSVADKWLDLGSFSTGFSNSGSLGGAGGGLASGKLTAQDVHTMLGASNTGVDLTETLLKGTHLKSVEIEAYRTNSITGDLQLVDDYLFEEALVSSVQSSASADSGIASGISVNYGKFGYTHVDYDAKGAKSTTTSTGWDLTKNVLSDGPAATGEAANSKLGEQASTESNLDYYVKFDGAAGWLDISALSLGFSNSGSSSIGGGAGTGKASASDVSLILGSSGEIVNLTHLLASGTILKNVEIEVYSHVGGKAQLVDDYLFENVLMTSLATGSDSANSVSFAYQKFTESHIGLDAKGAPIAPDIVGWDFAANAPYTSGSINVGNLFG